MLPMMLMMTAAFAQEVAFEETNKAIEEAEAYRMLGERFELKRVGD